MVLAVCAAAPIYSTVKLVSVLPPVIAYWVKKESAPVRVTRAVPVPVSEPAPLITAVATGARIAFAPLMFREPPDAIAKLLLSVSGFVVLESVRLKKVIKLALVMLCAGAEPLKLNVLVPALKVPDPKLKLPPTFVVLLLPVKFAVPVMMKLVGDIALPAVLVQAPFVVISRSPPMVVLVPESVTAPAAEILLPAVVAVLPEKVMLGVVPFRAVLLPPATYNPPPRLPAELEVNEVVAILRVLILWLMIPPPLAVPVAPLLVKAEVLMLPVPTETLNS